MTPSRRRPNTAKSRARSAAIDHERNPDFGLVRKAEPGREDADHREGAILQLDGRAQRRASATVAALPQRVADDRHAAVHTAALFLVGEVAAHDRPDRHRRRPARGPIDHLHALGGVRPDQRQILTAQGDERLEDLAIALKGVHVLAVHAERAPVSIGTAKGIEQPQDPIRFRERQRTKEHGVDEAEDGGIAADAERERQDHGHREPRRSPQQPQAEAEILPEHLHVRVPADRPDVFHEQRRAAELEAGSPLGRRRRHAALNVRGDGGVEVSAEFLIQLALVLMRTKQGADLGHEPPQQRSGGPHDPASSLAMATVCFRQSSVSTLSRRLPASVIR